MFILPVTNILDLSGNYAVTGHCGSKRRLQPCDKKYENLPVNVNLVESLRCGTFKIQSIETAVYTIKFMFVGNEVTWYFKTKYERDNEFENILNLK